MRVADCNRAGVGAGDFRVQHGVVLGSVWGPARRGCSGCRQVEQPEGWLPGARPTWVLVASRARHGVMADGPLPRPWWLPRHVAAEMRMLADQRHDPHLAPPPLARAYGALARAGFRRYATYRQAMVAATV